MARLDDDMKADNAFDPAALLTYFSLLMVGLLTLFLCVCIAWRVYSDKDVGIELWAAFTGMVGWMTAKLGSIFDNRWGSSRQSAAKDVTIADLAKTAKPRAAEDAPLTGRGAPGKPLHVELKDDPTPATWRVPVESVRAKRKAKPRKGTTR